MRKLQYILILIIALSSCNTITTKKIDSKTYKKALTDTGEKTVRNNTLIIPDQKLPQFGNGWHDLKKYLRKEIKYPKSAIKDSIQGTVYVGFVINKYGVLSNARILRGVRPDLNNECIKVIKNMPNWKPGKQRGKPVDVTMGLSIKFSFKADSSSMGVIIMPGDTNKTNNK